MKPPADIDFTREVVPVAARLSWIQVISIWVGFILVVGIMAVGGGLAGQLSRQNFFWAVVIGNLILAVFAAFTGFFGAKTGMAFNQMIEIAFPGPSRPLANLYVPVVLVGWYAVESALFGHFVGEAFHLSVLQERIVMVISACFFAVSSYIGFRGLKWVSYSMVPIILVLGAYSVSAVFKETGLTFGFGTTISLASGISIVVGSWIMGVLTSLPDLTRFCRKPLHGALVGALGIFFANGFNLMIGGYGASLVKNSDPALILTSLGFVVAGLAFSLANIWTTNDSNLYSASLNLSSATNLQRRKCVLICVAFGVVLTVFNPARLSFIFAFLIFMGNTAPALAGVVYTSCYASSRGAKVCPVVSWFAWLLGSTISYWAGGLIGMLVGLCLSSLLILATSRRFALSNSRIA